MPLSKVQLESITEIIKRRFLSFSFEALGERALTPDEIEALQSAGLIRRSVRHMVADPAVLGKIVALLPPSARTMTYDDILSMAKRLEHSLTGVEKQAVDFATEHAGEYITGLKDVAVRDARAMSHRSSSSALRAVQEGVKEAITNRETVSELKTNLFGMLDDKVRDWQRVAHTEMNAAIQNGVYREIREKSSDGEDQLVFKRPAPDACKHCKRLYLVDGIRPKIFRLKDLTESNVGMKAPNWQPTIGPIHPWCHCQLHPVPEGYGFEKMRVATDEIGEIKSGQIVEDDVYSKLSPENKDKIKYDSILVYKGKTAKPD